MPQLKASLRIEASGVHGNADEYMFSTSSILKLDPADEICYQVTEQENGETLCMITVNDETYNANELVLSQSE